MEPRNFLPLLALLNKHGLKTNRDIGNADVLRIANSLARKGHVPEYEP